MNAHGRVVLSVLALALVLACAGTKVSERDTLVKGRLPRPDHIYVYDFAAAPAEVPPESALTGHPSVSPQPQTAQQIALGRKVGSELAMDLRVRDRRDGSARRPRHDAAAAGAKRHCDPRHAAQRPGR